MSFMVSDRSKPKLLDLFCGAGGAAMGYHRAGFEVVGVDLLEQPNYPFEFHRGDAFQFLCEHGAEFDAFHASPPCQEYSRTKALRYANQEKGGYISKAAPMLVPSIRLVMAATGKPWVLENVEGAPMPSAFYLCGSMFDLPIRRHRLFESSMLVLAPRTCSHGLGSYGMVGGRLRGTGTFSSGKMYADHTGYLRRRESYPTKDIAIKAMGIDWMTLPEMAQAIPPAYTEYIGRWLLRAMLACL